MLTNQIYPNSVDVFVCLVVIPDYKSILPRRLRAFFRTAKTFHTATYYRLRQWTVQSITADPTVHYNSLYSPLSESVIGCRMKKLNHAIKRT